MAFSINSVRNTVLFLLSKENYGTIDPDKFNSFCELAQLSIFEELFYSDNTATVKKNNHLTNLQYADLKKIKEEQIDLFSEYSTTSNFIYDTVNKVWTYTEKDLYRAVNISLVNSNTNKKVDIQEVLKGVELNKILNSNMVAPTTTYPIAVRLGNDFKVYPENIDGYYVELLYIRKPKSPKWTFINDNGNPIYNASAPDRQDIELHISLYEKFIVKVMAYCGISLKENDITQIAQQEDINLTQKQS